MNPSSPAFSLVLMVLLIAMIYFMMIRPQRKKEKADKEMRDALRVGDEVITIGGIVGKVEKITDKTVIISTTAGKNKIEFLKSPETPKYYVKVKKALQEKWNGKKVKDAKKMQVDAVTGATLTSNGVSLMLKEGLKPFMEILKNK